MNAVIAAVGVMLILSLSRVHVVIALIVGALVEPKYAAHLVSTIESWAPATSSRVELVGAVDDRQMKPQLCQYYCTC